jgi:hypothetical protein
MRLMEPSPGEIWDRITILDLKINHSSRQEFRDEHRLLREYYDSKKYTGVSKELIDEMSIINSRLWELEDSQRKLLKRRFPTDVLDTDTERFLNNAVEIVHLNDARAETVQKINVACGINSMEKLHDTDKNS